MKTHNRAFLLVLALFGCLLLPACPVGPFLPGYPLLDYDHPGAITLTVNGGPGIEYHSTHGIHFSSSSAYGYYDVEPYVDAGAYGTVQAIFLYQPQLAEGSYSDSYGSHYPGMIFDLLEVRIEGNYYSSTYGAGSHATVSVLGYDGTYAWGEYSGTLSDGTASIEVAGRFVFQIDIWS